MQIAEETDKAAVVSSRQEHPRRCRFSVFLWFDWVARLVTSLKIATIQSEIERVFARQHGIGLRACGYEHSPRRQRAVELFYAAVFAGPGRAHGQPTCVAELVHHHRCGCKVLGEADAFLQRL